MKPRDPSIRLFQPQDADWLIRENVAHYTGSDGFDESFADVVREVVHCFGTAHDPALEHGWIAMQDGRRVGSIFCVKTEAPTIARLKLFYLTSDMRGQGLGRRLLDGLVDFARMTGRTKVVLRTHESHHAAGRLYTATGFRLVASLPRRSFGVEVVEQHFERDLA